MGKLFFIYKQQPRNMLYLNDNFIFLCNFNGNNRRAGIIISVITGSTLFKFYNTDLVTDVTFFHYYQKRILKISVVSSTFSLSAFLSGIYFLNMKSKEKWRIRVGGVDVVMSRANVHVAFWHVFLVTVLSWFHRVCKS